MQTSLKSSTAPRKAWVSPRLNKVGTIGDVAGTGTANTQTGGGAPPRS